MISYMMILVGVLFILYGFYRLMKYMEMLRKREERLEYLLQDERYQTIETLKQEVDELNYSYYEILDNLNERISKLEAAGLEVVPTEDNLKNEMKVEDKTVHQQTEPQSDKQRVQRLIDQGYSDQQIAKFLNLGSGKVALIRQVYVNKK